MVTVRGAGDDHKTALWEVHPDHPNGEVMIINEDAGVEAAETAAVKQGLANGTLLKYEGAARTAAPTPKTNGEEEMPTPGVRQIPRRG
jgi:hypothetical protein